MHVRIGYGIGAVPMLMGTPDGFGTVVDDLEQLGYDSLWFPERINSPQLDPIVAMSYVAGRTKKLKFGPAVSVVPGRNPVLMAKMLASLDVVSNGRCLPALGLGIANTAEHQAFQVDRKERAPWLNEAMPLMRRLWEEEEVDHEGERFSIKGARVLPKPIQNPLEVWLGGQAPSELRRTGRLADGWLASFTTPSHVAESIPVIEEAAEEAGRKMDPEHYGVLIPYIPGEGEGEVPEGLKAVVNARKPDADPRDVVATSRGRIVELVNEYLSVGASKFVLFPFAEPEDWTAELDALAQVALPLQT
ncbi:MAG: LLM class flavin-dependent oxidoreductase [Acidimicrobiales bacterium]|jgi:probable F420-dependent oxidoreductase|nr:LLM class flavin-dependent oxidoreductase [Acidimicrobiales bacterium]